MKKFEANNMDFIFDAVFNGAINLAIKLRVTQRYFISFLIVGELTHYNKCNFLVQRGNIMIPCSCTRKVTPTFFIRRKAQYI